MRRSLHEALHNTGDRGSVSLWVVIFAFVTLALLILIVDGGQVIVAKSRAADIAQQAARAAADDINPAALRNDDTAEMRRPSSQACSPISSCTRAVFIHSGPQSGQVPILSTVAVRSPRAIPWRKRAAQMSRTSWTRGSG